MQIHKFAHLLPLFLSIAHNFPIFSSAEEIHQAKAQLLQKFAPPPPSPPAAKVVPTPPVVVSGPRVAVSGARAQASPSPSPAAKAVLSPPVAKAVASPPPSLLSKLAAKATLGGGY